MPYPDGNPFAAPTIVSERLILSKFQPVQVETFNLYVDSDTGQDESPGNGTQELPYRTIPRALTNVASSSLRECSIINLSGAAPHKIPTGYIFPAIFSSDKPGFSGTGFFTQQGPLTIRATPIPIITVQPGDITGQTFSPGSSLVTVATSLVLVPNALQKKAVRTLFGSFGRVISNTANTITLSFFGAVVAPLEIFDEGATIEPEAPGSFMPTLCFRGLGAVVLQGLVVKEDGGIPGSSLDASQGQTIIADACSFESVSLGLGFFETGAGLFSGNGCLIDAVQVASGKFLCSTSYFNFNFESGLPGPLSSFVASQCYFDTPLNFTVDQFSKLVSYSYCELLNCTVNASDADNAVYQIGGRLLIKECLFSNNAKDWSIVADLGASVRVDTVVLNNNNRAVRIDGGSYAELLNVTGAGNLAGAQVNNGAQAKVNALTSILGGPELVVGSLPATTWAAFHGVKNAFDATAITGQLSRCWEP